MENLRPTYITFHRIIQVKQLANLNWYKRIPYN